MGETDSQRLLETVGNREKREGNRKLRMTQSQNVSIIYLGAKEKESKFWSYLDTICHHYCVNIHYQLVIATKTIRINTGASYTNALSL